MPVKKSTNVSLRATAKQSSLVNTPTKIATKPSVSRNDKKETTRANLSIPVYSLTGQAAGMLALPKEVFGVKVNKKLLSQAMRVYSTNQKSLFGSTKTRGEVEGSTAKIYRQKGTGRARHGAIRAPIFVGGGITFGPKPRIVRLTLPQKMKKAALLSALSAKTADKQLISLSGIEKASGKTKEMVQLLKQLSSKFKVQSSKLGSALIVTGEKQDNVVRAVRNIPTVGILPINLINAYEVLRHESLLITKEAVAKLGNYTVIASEAKQSSSDKNLTQIASSRQGGTRNDKRRILK